MSSFPLLNFCHWVGYSISLVTLDTRRIEPYVSDAPLSAYAVPPNRLTSAGYCCWLYYAEQILSTAVAR
jgi:hypothetical protein